MLMQLAKEPIILKNNFKKIETTRKTFYDENANKIRFKKGFVFHDFMTDKQKLVRIRSLYYKILYVL